MKCALLILFLPLAALAQEYKTCALLVSSDDPRDLVYDSTFHTYAFEQLYPAGEEYGWIGHRSVDLGVPDSMPYDEGGVWRQDFGDYAMIWLPGGCAYETYEYDPPDLDVMYPLMADEWGEPVASLSFHRCMGVIVAKSLPSPCSYDTNGDGEISPVDVVYLVQYVYNNVKMEPCK